MIIETDQTQPIGKKEKALAAADRAPSPSFSEAPPAYDIGSGPTPGTSTRPIHRSLATGSINTPDGAVTIDKISIEHRHKDITGKYHVVPRPKKKFLGMSMNEDSEVRFTSREGSIDLSLSVGGGVSLSDAVSIKAGSREGNVAVNVTSLTPHTRMSLSVRSREGHAALFLPRDYCGSVRMSTHGGTLNLLPGISALSRLVKATDRKQVLHFGSLVGNDTSIDSCNLYSRAVTTTLGLFGVDNFVPPEKVKRGKSGGAKKSDDDDSDLDDSDSS